MNEQEVNAVAAELATARAGKPSQPGALRKRVLYSAEGVQKAVRLYHQSGQAPSVFAQRLGVSASALTRWVVDAKDGSAFIPLRVADERAAGAEPVATPAIREASAPMAPAVVEARIPEAASTKATPPPAATVVVREMVISIPADVDLGRVREIMMALRGGAAC